ncbi:MAG: hypothetical protein IZT59_05575 [Verrucomicrobia bacterium]|jgi:mono/diheme cytochrome c family protein|nr:hypothetical protein [Verrucomicrobiota bacterium]|tara:strand:+ start:44742 stop:46871 length:2130 start_codon:yes stop_codon:yes gene_type:complete
MRQLLLPIFLIQILPAQEKISYDDHVLAIFEQSCLNCHNPDKTKGGLDLLNFAGAMKGGSSGKVVEPGDTSSTLINAVMRTAEPKMPPECERFSAKDIEILSKWIAGGLLENKSSKARKPSKPKFQTALRSDLSAKPEGSPPIPEHILLEPPIVTERPSAVHAIATSPRAPLLAVTSQKQILLHNTETLELVGILPFPEGHPISLAFTPDARYLIVGGGIPGKNGFTITFDVTNGSRVVTAGKEFDSILAADIRPGFDIVATGGPSKLLKLWDTQTGKQIQSIKKHTDWITALDISPDGILRAHQAGITALSFRSDSNLLGTAPEDGTVRFWEMNNGNEVKKIDAHLGGVTAFAFAKNGTFITAGRDNKAKLWKSDFTLLREIKLPALATATAVDFENKTAFVADAFGNIHAFSAEKKGTPELQSFPTNPPTIETRLQQISTLITSAQEKIDAAEAAEDVRKKSIQSTTDALKAAEKTHHQAKLILQASIKGLNEANQRLANLKATPEIPPLEVEKANTARQAADKTCTAAQARLEPRRKQIEAARKAVEEAGKDSGAEKKNIESALAEIELLRSREKSWSAAAINTHALKAASQARILVQQNEEKIDTFRQSLTDLESPTEQLNRKRSQRNEFAAALEKTTLQGIHLEEAKGTLRALDASVKNLEDTLHEKETELARFHREIDSTTKKLAAAQSQSTHLRERYLQALK